jgi:signal transduction histidine kinase
MKVSPPNNDHTQHVDKVIEFLSQEHGLAFARLSPELTLTWSSHNFKDLLIDPPGIIHGMALPELLWEFVGSESELKNVLSGQVPVYRLERVNRQNPDGSLSYLNFLVLPLNEPQSGEGLLLILEDVTRTGQLEQQLVQDRNELRLAQAELARANASLEKLNHLKSLFLSIAAHDMRTPLTAIAGYTDLISSSLSQDVLVENREHLSSIRSLVEQLDRLIADFLDLDSIEQGALSIQPVTCDLNPLVRQVTSGMTKETMLHSLELTLNLHSSPIQVEADPERVQQILYNLLSNAIKYTPAGGRVQVSTWSDSEYGILQVQDSGIGIPESEFDQLFELYYRTEESRKSQVRGKGLGLFIVKSLVESHQGKIKVKELQEGGTVFTVYLPSTKT